MSYLFILSFVLLSGIADFDATSNYSHDIILIQGEPKLVAMTESGEIIRTFDVITDYFTSDNSHDEILKKEINRSEELMRTRFISFEATPAELTEDAVEHLRYITVLAEKDPELNVVITAPDSEDARDVTMITKSLVEGFGVNQKRIRVITKKYYGDEENQFIIRK